MANIPKNKPLKDIKAGDPISARWLNKIKNSETLFKLIKLLAFQIGQMVSLNELAKQIHIDVKTVGKYIDLLEKSFIIYKLSGFSGNLRKEITKKHKYCKQRSTTNRTKIFFG